MDSGIVEAFEAMVRAYDYYALTYDADSGVSLSRMLKDVFSPMREGNDTHLSHCAKCGVVHLSHEEKSGIIECPVCVLSRGPASTASDVRASDRAGSGQLPARLPRSGRSRKAWPPGMGVESRPA